MKTLTLFGLILFSLSNKVTAQDSIKTRYRLVVSFQSECCGVPSEDPFIKYIRAFRKRNKIPKITAYHIGPMGKEGEYYLAFKLKELNRKLANKFVSGMKSVKKDPKDKGLFSIEENMIITPETLPQRATVTIQHF